MICRAVKFSKTFDYFTSKFYVLGIMYEIQDGVTIEDGCFFIQND